MAGAPLAIRRLRPIETPRKNKKEAELGGAVVVRSTWLITHKKNVTHVVELKYDL